MSQIISVAPARRPHPQAGTRPTLGLPAALRAIGNEVYKGMMAAWNERLQILIELTLFIPVALLLAAVLGKGDEMASGEVVWSFDEYQTTWIFIGYAVFMFYYLQTAKIFWRTLAEIQTGTLEQVHLSPLPSWVIAIAGGVLASIVETLLVLAGVYVAVELLVGLDLSWRIEGLLPLLFVVAGATGYALVIGGLVMIWKRIEMINEGLFAVVFIFGGLFVPLERMPDWAAAAARLLPLVHGTLALRRVFLDGGSATAMRGDGGLVWLATTTAVWLLAGILVFQLGERIAKRQGSLSRY